MNYKAITEQNNTLCEIILKAEQESGISTGFSVQENRHADGSILYHVSASTYKGYEMEISSISYQEAYEKVKALTDIFLTMKDPEETFCICGREFTLNPYRKNKRKCWEYIFNSIDKNGDDTEYLDKEEMFYDAAVNDPESGIHFKNSNIVNENIAVMHAMREIISEAEKKYGIALDLRIELDLNFDYEAFVIYRKEDLITNYLTKERLCECIGYILFGVECVCGTGSPRM